MKLTKKRIAIAASIFVLMGLLALAKVKANNRATQFKTQFVRRKDLVGTVSASGKIKAQKQVTLKFQTSGKLAWVGVKEGDYVKKGQAIACLDKRELQRKLLKKLRDYSNERWDFEQAKEDYKDQILTDTVKRILEKNQFNLDKAVADVEIADIALKLATLISPINGIIIHVDNPVAGVNITPATATFTIADPKVMVFKANVDEIDIAKIKLGQKVAITLDAYPKTKINGQITRIGFAATTTRGGGTAFPVEVKLPANHGLRFKVGMNGDMEVVIEKREKVLAVPNGAIHYKNSKAYVKVLENNRPREKEVKTGLETDTETEITQGLSGNQKVVIGEKK